MVPGKAVFPVKPPSEAGRRFKRKARIVTCGNFVAKNEEEDSHTVLAQQVAEAARRYWALVNGDVKNAFLRTPIPPGTVLALRPPHILVGAGLAQPDEVWEVKTAFRAPNPRNPKALNPSPKPQTPKPLRPRSPLSPLSPLSPPSPLSP